MTEVKESVSQPGLFSGGSEGDPTFRLIQVTASSLWL